jgi:hypothetical protein
MTQAQLIREIIRRLEGRHARQEKVLPFLVLVKDVAEICIELGLMPGDLILEPQAGSPRVDYLVAVDAVDRIAATPLPMAIQPAEVKDAMLAAVAAGTIDRLDISWRPAIEPAVRFGDWSLELFIEADAVYDVYWAEAPDGRTQEFDEEEDPWDLLNAAEKLSVHRALGGRDGASYDDAPN